MELTLVHKSTTQIGVACDGQYSHPFDLSAIPPLKLSETQHSLFDPILYGQTLYNILFPSGTFARKSLNESPKRIVLVLIDEDLDAIAWEYLHSTTSFLVQEYHFVRALPTEYRIPPPTLDSRLHIVAIPANPLSSDIAPLNIDAEWQRLTEIVNVLPFALTLERTRPPTIKQLRASIAGQHHRVVHFMGHGRQHRNGAVLCFEKENGDLDLVQARDFALRVRDTTFLVTLNACDSAAPGDTSLSNLASALVHQKIPYALGMRLRFPDDDALLFSRTFYNDLTRGTSVEEALLQARLTLASESTHPWVVGVPVLYTSLATPAPGFVCEEGLPTILEHQPHIEVSALPHAEGTFQGRTEDLKRLGQLLTSDKRPRILTIHGGGGQGKTALAREAVERFSYAWPGGVWGTTLENLPDRTSFTANLARFLNINTQEISDPDEVERRVFARLTLQRILLVLDNAETLVDAVDADNPDAIHLGQFLQQLPSTTVSLLVTSRVPLGWKGETVYDELGGLSSKEGGMLFEQCAPQKIKEIDRETVREISEKVEGHPLSLRLLGSAFNASTLTLDAFIEEYEAQLMKAQDKYRDMGHRHRTLYACIDISTCNLNTNLRNLLSGLWIFHAPFQAETAVSIFDPKVVNTEKIPSLVHDFLHALWQRSLLTHQSITVRDGTLHSYHLLSTMRPYIEQYLPSPYPREELLSRFGATYAVIAGFLDTELDRSAFAVAMAQQIEVDIERAGQYLTVVEQGPYKVHYANILFRIGTPQHSLKLLEEVLEQAEGHEPRLVLQVLNGMAAVCGRIGQWRQALHHLEQALLIDRDLGNRAGEATTLNNMAEIYRLIGQWKRALSLYEQALPITREVSDREVEAGVLNNMAEVCRAIGQWEQALGLYEQSLSISHELGNHVREAMTLNNIARVYNDIGQWEQALGLYEQSLSISHELGNYVGEAMTLNNMGILYDNIGLNERALGLYKQALPIRRKAGDRAGEGKTLNNMAEVYRTTGQWEQALGLYEQALFIMREVNDRAGEAVTLNNLALVYLNIGQRQRALSLFEQSLPIARSTGDHAQEAMTLHNTAALCESIGQWEQALGLYERVLPIMREVNNHAGEAMALNNMAGLLYSHFKRTSDALFFMQKAIDVLKQTNLPQDAAGQTQEQLQRRIQAMRQGTLLTEQANTVTTSTSLNEEETEVEEDNLFDTLVMNTLAVLGPMQDRLPEWYTTLSRMRSHATGGGRQDLITLLTEQGQQDLVTLLDAIIGLLDAGGNPAGLGMNLTGLEAQVWQDIVTRLSIDGESTA